jgi:hypothetical protein
MVAGAKRASCWLACLAPLLCASKWFGEGCARVEDALVRPPKVILHPKSASPPKRWPSWPCLGWAVPHNRAFPRPILRRGLFHRPILRRGLCYARSREEGFVTPDPQNRALLRPIPTPGDPDPDAPIPRARPSSDGARDGMPSRFLRSLRLSPHAPQRMRDAHVLWSGLVYGRSITTPTTSTTSFEYSIFYEL